MSGSDDRAMCIGRKRGTPTFGWRFMTGSPCRVIREPGSVRWRVRNRAQKSQLCAGSHTKQRLSNSLPALLGVGRSRRARPPAGSSASCSMRRSNQCRRSIPTGGDAADTATATRTREYSAEAHRQAADCETAGSGVVSRIFRRVVLPPAWRRHGCRSWPRRKQRVSCEHSAGVANRICSSTVQLVFAGNSIGANVVP
jgi:hypothetical protein